MTHLVAYLAVDLAEGNTFSGYACLAYSYALTARSKYTKHPRKSALNFTESGIQKEKSAAPMTVENIYELIQRSGYGFIETIPDAITETFSLASSLENIESLTVIHTLKYLEGLTDLAFGEGRHEWVKNGGVLPKRAKPIESPEKWKAIVELHDQLVERNVRVSFVKEDVDPENYAQTLCKTMAAIGSNSARTLNEAPFNVNDVAPVVLRSCLAYPEFKESYDTKDLIYYFKDLFFSSDPTVQDDNFCMLASAKDDHEVGKRNFTSNYSCIHGHIPPLIHRLKTFFRSEPRYQVMTCSVRLTEFENRDLLRLAEVVPLTDMLRSTSTGSESRYKLVGGKLDLLQENTMGYPFVREIMMMMDFMETIEAESQEHTKIKDVTDVFVKEGKLVLDNAETHKDFSHLASELGIKMTQNFIAHTGFDYPSYLALKKIEADIQSVFFIMSKTHDSNFMSFHTKFVLPDRVLYSTSVRNKYLVRHF
ncbi:MAG: hypothetical protein PHN51_11930 [Candidatus Nanopelagicales bacterium]|nr:hypothetical protein [Candidatus Nanopelagicales bacterium]